MALADSSQAVLLRGAQVQVTEQRSNLVHIVQQSGSVRYEVRPDPAREFVVFAAGVQVRVRGTVFTVTVEGGSVEVSVERGKVEVNDGAQTRNLVVGESLRVPARGADGFAPSAAFPPYPDPAPGALPATAVRLTYDELMVRADAARAHGKQEEAAAVLGKVLAFYPSDARAPSAAFTLGKVERARGRHSASGRAFDRCWRMAPAGALAQDALAEAALSWTRAGYAAAAAGDARLYLERSPDAMRAPQMRVIAER